MVLFGNTCKCCSSWVDGLKLAENPACFVFLMYVLLYRDNMCIWKCRKCTRIMYDCYQCRYYQSDVKNCSHRHLVGKFLKVHSVRNKSIIHLKNIFKSNHMCDSSHVNNPKAFIFHGVGRILLTLSLQPQCCWTVFARRINSLWLTNKHLKWICVVMLFLNCTDIEKKY